MFRQLHQNFGGSLGGDSGEYELEIDNDIGRGTIRGFAFKGDVHYLDYDMEFLEDVTMVTCTTERPPFHFAYCSQGRLTHRFGNEVDTRTLKNFRTGILSCAAHGENILYFEKNVRLKISLITVNAPIMENSVDRDDLYETLGMTFPTKNPSQNFAYIGSFNLQIAEKIRQLDFVTRKGIARNLLIEGSVHMIMGLEIQQHGDDISRCAESTGTLTAREMRSIKELSDFIGHYPETDLRIDLLSRKSGISPIKLQEGFKLMHGRTVTDHIRNVRIQKSEKMIKETDLNISEIVYSIGFSSRSYFSKIFKRKYHCSPKKYRDNLDPSAISA